MDSIRLFFAFSKVSMLTQMEYRMGYLVRMLGKLLQFGGGFAVLAIMLFRFQHIGTWSAHEVLFLYAINSLTYAIAATFTMNIAEISSRIRSGSFDAILTRPVNPLYLSICQNASAGYVVNYILGISVMLIAGFNLDISVTFGSMLLLIVSMLGGVLIHAAALIASGVPSFWMVRNSSFFRILYARPSSFVDYPINIYGTAVQGILTILLPYAFISFYPAGLFLGKAGENLFPVFVYYLSLPVGIILFAGAYKFWKIGLNAYQSTGS